MPIPKKWSRATRSHVESNAPAAPGVYELKNFGRLVYIGYSVNVQRRLCAHLRKSPTYYRYRTCRSKRDAKRAEDEHLSRYEDRHGQLPDWNSNDTRDDRRGLLSRLLG